MRGDCLLAVQVAESDVAEPVEQGGGHLADAADGDVALGFAGGSPADPAVRHHDPAADAAGPRVGPDTRDRVPEDPGVSPRRGGFGGFRRGVRGLAVPERGSRGELGADGIGLEVGDPVHGHRPVAVGEHDQAGQRTRPGAQVHAGLIEQAAAEPEPARGVVVAADQHDSGAGRVQPEQGVLAQLDRVHRRHRAIVDVPATRTASTFSVRTVSTR